MVSIQNISVSFGSFDLLDSISFLINDQDRIGLAGKNGAGKSTLLKVIAGLQNPASGQVDIPKDVTIGYLPQQMKVDDTTTVMNEVLTDFSELLSDTEEIQQCHSEIARREEYEAGDSGKSLVYLARAEDRDRERGGRQ
jgi:ATP-binding cassette subfamily F protein 3